MSGRRNVYAAIAREAARQARERERTRREAARREREREREAKRRELESRLQEAEDANRDLEEQIRDLKNVLPLSLKIDHTIAFDSLRIHDAFTPFALPPGLETPPLAPNLSTFLDRVKRPGFLARLVPGTEKRLEAAIERAKSDFAAAEQAHQRNLETREERIAASTAQYEKEKAAFDLNAQQRNHAVDELERDYVAGEPEALISCCTMVLDRSAYPDGFPHKFRVAYLRDSKEVVVDYDLPDVHEVPAVAEHRYVRTKDMIEKKPRKAAEVKELYQDLVASICLRTIHEVLEADYAKRIDVVVFSGFVDSIDPATGRDTRPCLISVRTTRERFSEVNLARVDWRACLRNLGAQVSPRPEEMLAVKPIVEFDMVDKRFVEQGDVLSELESRPNLMELDPFEFEELVSNLFGRMGFETKLTRQSRDAGVDAVAFDSRPVIGGKLVIQAKRYSNTVGVSAVRDLYGTMLNEGANKGILVTTSHYGTDAYDFARDKPIELIDGGGLLYLLEKNGVRARIVFLTDAPPPSVAS